MKVRVRNISRPAVWLKGLASAIIGAAANSVTVVLVDPVTFSEWQMLAKVAGVSAIVAAAMYLKQSPVWPDPPTDQ